MENEDPIVVLTHRLESLIEKVIDRKFAERDQKLERMAATLELTHDLVNSRMTALTAALGKIAALEKLLAGEEGEVRGAANERAKHPAAPEDG